MINIVNATFITSSTGMQNVPELSISEIAFLGRSNVGKSSFINALTNNKHLAKSSQTPGKTQLINFFDVKVREKKDDDTVEDYNLIFVDLPGYGYAKVAKKLQNIWQKNLDEFLKKRINIKLFIHLIDSRHFDLEIDKQVDDYINSFLRNDQKILRIYTKEDKINQSQKSALLKFDPNANLVSISKPSTIDKIKEKIIYQALCKAE